MSRVALPLSCTAEVMQELVHLSKSRTDEARLIERAKIVLRCLAGERNDGGVLAPGGRPVPALPLRLQQPRLGPLGGDSRDG